MEQHMYPLPKWHRVLLISFVIVSIFKVAPHHPIGSVNFSSVYVQT